MTTSVTTHQNATREKRQLATRTSSTSSRVSTAAASTTRPPSHTAIAATCSPSARSASTRWSPVEACPANPGEPTSPTPTTAATGSHHCGSRVVAAGRRAKSTRSTTNATARSTNRASQTVPNRVSRVSRSISGSSASPRLPPREYAPNSSAPTAVDAVRPIQPAVTMRRVTRASRARGQITAPNATPPTRRAREANTTQRAMPQPMATARSACWPASSPAATASVSDADALALPTWKVQVPWIGCESSDTARQVTMYEPSASSPSIGRTRRSGAGWRSGPSGTRSPLLS